MIFNIKIFTSITSSHTSYFPPFTSPPLQVPTSMIIDCCCLYTNLPLLTGDHSPDNTSWRVGCESMTFPFRINWDDVNEANQLMERNQFEDQDGAQSIVTNSADPSQSVLTDSFNSDGDHSTLINKEEVYLVDSNGRKQIKAKYYSFNSDDERRVHCHELTESEERFLITEVYYRANIPELEFEEDIMVKSTFIKWDFIKIERGSKRNVQPRLDEVNGSDSSHRC